MHTLCTHALVNMWAHMFPYKTQTHMHRYTHQGKKDLSWSAVWAYCPLCWGKVCEVPGHLTSAVRKEGDACQCRLSPVYSVWDPCQRMVPFMGSVFRTLSNLSGNTSLDTLRAVSTVILVLTVCAIFLCRSWPTFHTNSTQFYKNIFF